MSPLKIAGFVVAGVLLLGFSCVGLLYLTRGTPVSTVRTFGQAPPPSVIDPLFRRTVDLLAGMTMQHGNDIEVLVNGDETYQRLWADLRSARQTITMQMYYANPGKVADTVKKLLIERARAGVRVLFLQDAIGSQNLEDEWQDSLR